MQSLFPRVPFFRFVSFSLHINKTCVLEHLFLRAHFVRICRHCPLFNFFCHRQTFVPRFLATIPYTGAQIKMASTAKARVLLSTGWLLISDTRGDKNRKEGRSGIADSWNVSIPHRKITWRRRYYCTFGSEAAKFGLDARAWMSCI